MGERGRDADITPEGRVVDWLSRRAVALHVVTIGVIGGCAFAFWWQLHRALDGNELSWAYTFEWPLFAGLAGVIWWQQVHEDPERVSHRKKVAEDVRQRSVPATHRWDAAGDDVGDDAEMAAYNRYLAELSSSGRRKSWRGS